MNKLGLYEHNLESYLKVKEALGKDDIAAIVHATGTGKSYNALQLAYDNLDKKIVYIVPSNSIIEHLQNIIKSNHLENELNNIEFRTYQSFVNMSEDEIKNIELDMLILDEFHHIGAPIWGNRINKLIETHPNIKIFGMTAYTVRDRGTAYERDMANPNTNELFSNKVVSRYDLVDAMIDGVLPKPIYKSACVNLLGSLEEIESKVLKLNHNTKEYQDYMKMINTARKRIQEAPSIKELLKSNLKPNGKYIYFCPNLSESGTNDIETIIEEAKSWMKEMGLDEEDYAFYQTTSEMGLEGKKNREAFYYDKTLDGQDASDKLQIMFAINQYNEGVHAPNIDGVIMGRGTNSDIVYFEQLGRALSVRGNNKEQVEKLYKLSVEELMELCRQRSIEITTESKEEIIEKLTAPLIIDLTNNFKFISELEDRLKERIKLEQNNGNSINQHFKLSNPTFDIEVLNQDLFNMLLNLRNNLNDNWMKNYELAKLYYIHHGHLNIPYKFLTINGYEEYKRKDENDNNGVNLGTWIYYQRTRKDSLTEEQVKLLDEIGMRWDYLSDLEWNKNYELAKSYYEHHGHLNIPYKFLTINGYEEYKRKDENDNNGVNLGIWISYQRTNKDSLSTEKIKLLDEIKIRWEYSEDLEWTKNYELAKSYYKHYGNLSIKKRYVTINGYEEYKRKDENDSNGINLGTWIRYQRQHRDSLSEEKIKLLDEIGMIWENVKEKKWNDKYKLAKSYYEHHGHLNIPYEYITINGYEEYKRIGKNDDEGVKLGIWILSQRMHKDSLSKEKIQLLDAIGMRWENLYNLEWEKSYELAKSYYEHHGHLNVPGTYITINGYEEYKRKDENDNNGINLGRWVSTQRTRKDFLSEEQVKLLDAIGMRWESLNNLEWKTKYELTKAYYLHHGNLDIPLDYITINGYEYNENGVNLGKWIRYQRTNKDCLPKEKIKLLDQIGMIWEYSDDMKWNKNYELAKTYYEHYGNLNIPKDFKTINGYEYDEKGVKLGSWISHQRTNKDSLSEEKIKLLDQIGMIWEYFDDIKWKKMYELAKAYYEHYGNLLIKIDFKTINGYEYNENGVNLGKWISHQRENKDFLSEYKTKLLEQIGMRWDNLLELIWNKNYELAKAYYERYGNLNIPQNYITINGYEYDEKGVKLGSWISNQRERLKKKTMPKKQQEKLEQIEFIIDNRINIQWKKMYELATTYYEHYGNLNIPQNYITINGYEYDENGAKLGSWISGQKKKMFNGSISNEKKILLIKIGMKTEKLKDIEWETMFNLARIYYEYHGNLSILQNYITINGYEYDEKGVKLGSWISYQRKSKNSLSEEQVKLLDAIGMIWNVKLNKKQILEICSEYNINYELNKNVLKNISICELQAKIDYLQENNLDITINGKLHEIFKLSSVSLKEKYGISFEELINNYKGKNRVI